MKNYHIKNVWILLIYLFIYQNYLELWFLFLRVFFFLTSVNICFYFLVSGSAFFYRHCRISRSAAISCYYQFLFYYLCKSYLSVVLYLSVSEPYCFINSGYSWGIKAQKNKRTNSEYRYSNFSPHSLNSTQNTVTFGIQRFMIFPTRIIFLPLKKYLSIRTLFNKIFT